MGLGKDAGQAEVKQNQNEANLDDLTPESLGIDEKMFKELGLGKKKEAAKKLEKAKAEPEESPKAKSSKDAVASSDAKSELEKLLKLEDDKSEDDDAEESDENESDDEEQSEDDGSSDEESDDDGDADESEDDKTFKIMHNDNEVELSEKEMKEYAQKGFDYTKKTQALAEERKKHAAEVKEVENALEDAYKKLEADSKALEEKVMLYEKFDLALKDINGENPELYNEIARYFQKAERQVSNPFFESKVKALQNEIESLRSSVTEKQHSSKLGEYASEKQEIERGELGSKLKSIGLNVDWDAVKKEWAETGKGVKQAIYIVHGDDIRHLMESKAKVASSKKAAEIKSRVKTSAGYGQARGSKSKIDISKMSQQQIKDAIASGKMSYDDFINS